MKKKVLVFGSTDKMAEFIIAMKKYNVIVNFPTYTVTGLLSDREVFIACSEYGAHISTKSDYIVENDAESQET